LLIANPKVNEDSSRSEADCSKTRDGFQDQEAYAADSEQIEAETVEEEPEDRQETGALPEIFNGSPLKNLADEPAKELK
jgi:hypothetical protein